MENKTILLTKNLPSASDTIQIVLGDNLAYRVHFVIERYWGDTDLNSLTWTINIRNASGEIYTASLTKYAHNNANVTLSWNLTGAASAVVGGADYTVVGKTSAQDTPIWKSPEGHINVLDAIGTGGTYEGVDPDPIEQMLLEIREYVDDLVIVSETEPVSETNKIWFEPTPESEVVVPTMAELEDVQADVNDLEYALGDAIYQELNASQTKPASGNAIITEEFRIIKNQAYLLTLETTGTATITTRLTNSGETVERLYAGSAVTNQVIVPAYDANYFRVVGSKDFTVSIKTLNSKTVYDLALANEQDISTINGKFPAYTTNYATLINGTAVVSDLDDISENISYRMNYAIGSTSIPANTPYGGAWGSTTLAYFQSIVKTPGTHSAGDLQLFIGSDAMYIRGYTVSWNAWAKVYDIDDSVTEAIQTTGTAVNYPIPYHIMKGTSYLITIDADSPIALNKLVTRETSDGTTIETVFSSVGECNNLLFTAEHDANYFAFVSSYGATVTISTLNAKDAYILAKTNEQNSKTDLSLNNLFNPLGYYATNQGVGGTASGTITPSANVIGLKVSCSAGDTFSITGEGASTGRLWCLTDENLKTLSVAATSKTETNLELEATANGYLIVNVYKNSTFNIIKHKGQLKTADLQEQIDEISTIDVYDIQSVSVQLYRSIATNGAVGSTVNVDNPSASSAFECAVVPVINGETYLLNGYGGSTPRLWCLTDGDYKILSASASSLDASTIPVTIEVANNGYLIINSNMSTGITLKKLRTDETLSTIQKNYTDIEALKSNKTQRDVDFDNLLNIPLVEFDLKDYEVLDVSSYRALVDYDSLSRPPMLEQFYSLFDSLVTDYPNYVSRVDAVTECSLSYPEYANGIETEGTYEVTPAYKTYMYKFIDTNIGAGNSAYNVKKKLLITCCTHGNEVMTPFNAFVLASELCKGTSPNYAKLRASFDIYIVPCLNGYGMYHNMRPNANWVDINRNFPTQRWYVDGASTIGDKNQCVYTGETAGSEFETQLVMALNELIEPDFHIDHHNYSGGNGQFYTNVTEQSFLRLVHQCLIDCSIAFVKAFPAYFGNEYLLIIPNSAITYAPRQTVDNKNGKMEVWFSENGCPFSCTIEIASDVRYNDGAITQTTQDWAGNTTFSIAEYTLRNQLLRYGQYVLQMP